ncbi:MAG: hypothetical protein ABI041_14400 [Bdellovibrionia bacterium]
MGWRIVTASLCLLIFITEVFETSTPFVRENPVSTIQTVLLVKPNIEQKKVIEYLPDTLIQSSDYDNSNPLFESNGPSHSCKVSAPQQLRFVLHHSRLVVLSIPLYEEPFLSHFQRPPSA